MIEEEKITLEKAVWNPGALLAPVPPTLVSCGSLEAPRVLTVAWTGILSTKPPKTYVSIRSERNSYGIIDGAGEFTINLPPASLVRAVDFCGVRSGAQVDKFAQLGLTAVPGVGVGAPSIAQCPISLECRVVERVPLGSHTMFLADIVKVLVREDCIDPAGKLLLERCDLLAYAHGSYFSLGESLGTFGFSVRKKPVGGKAKSGGERVPRGETGPGKAKSGGERGAPRDSEPAGTPGASEAGGTVGDGRGPGKAPPRKAREETRLGGQVSGPTGGGAGPLSGSGSGGEASPGRGGSGGNGSEKKRGGQKNSVEKGAQKDSRGNGRGKGKSAAGRGAGDSRGNSGGTVGKRVRPPLKKPL